MERGDLWIRILVSVDICTLYRFQTKYESMDQYLFPYSNKCLNHTYLTLRYCPAYCNVIQDTWICSVPKKQELSSHTPMHRTLPGYVRYGLNALALKKEEIEAGLPIRCSLVCLAKSVWVLRVQLTYFLIWQVVSECRSRSVPLKI